MAEEENFCHNMPSLSWEYCSTKNGELQQKGPLVQREAFSSASVAQRKKMTKNRLFGSGTNTRQHRHKNSATSIVAAIADMGG